MHLLIYPFNGVNDRVCHHRFRCTIQVIAKRLRQLFISDMRN
jgi:hypothetical protein